MRPRVEELYRVLKQTGSFYLHFDWHANAHLRIMMDEIFGEKNFQNEIVWYYRGGGISKRKFGRRHDILYFYTKEAKWIFNPDELRIPYSAQTLERLRYKARAFRKDKVYDTYEAHPLGKYPDDVWIMQPIMPSAKERLGYPTQKPEALLERIIKASSNKGDVVLDAFCGCGTTLAVAQKLRRNWIGVDISPTAVKVMKKRLKKAGAIEGDDYIVIGMPTTMKELKELKPFEFQNWVIDEMGAKHSRKKVGDKGIDGYFVKNLWQEEAGIQVKQSEGVGRNVVDNFKAALERKKYKLGFIVAFSFTKGALEEVARLRHEELEIRLIKVRSLLLKEKPIFSIK